MAWPSIDGVAIEGRLSGMPVRPVDGIWPGIWVIPACALQGESMASGRGDGRRDRRRKRQERVKAEVAAMRAEAQRRKALWQVRAGTGCCSDQAGCSLLCCAAGSGRNHKVLWQAAAGQVGCPQGCVTCRQRAQPQDNPAGGS